MRAEFSPPIWFGNAVPDASHRAGEPGCITTTLWRKRNVRSSTTLLIALALAAASPASAADTVKVGLSGPFTGGSSSMGVSMRAGVKLAVSEINKAGRGLPQPHERPAPADHAAHTPSDPIARHSII